VLFRSQDSRLDVLTNFQSDGTLGLIFSAGNWSYSPVAKIDGGPNMYAVSAADLNLDGVPDILSLDRTLRLGLAFINVDPGLVAVEPSAFAAACQGNRLTMEVRPDRPGPWRLEVGHDGDWQVVVEGGDPVWGTLDFERGSWFLSLRTDDMQDWEPYAYASWQARLTVGEGFAQESAIWPLVTDCLGKPNLASHGLAWQDKPWPNPFNPRVQASFRLRQSEYVTAAIYDLAGRLVAQLVAEEMPAGEHLVQWNGQAADGVASAGTYFLRVETAGNVITQKLVLVK